MLEKLVYNPVNDTEDNGLMENGVSNRLKSNSTTQVNSQCTLMDLVSVFSIEADKVCANKDLANSIALEALSDYVAEHVSNLKISS
ncbi:MAG: hypothetical protein GY777_01785 [Candidatus Brocadiaceae bacterium]|nr:hypothetical protein [Candidatus Brocadiaceae bacterium]